MSTPVEKPKGNAKTEAWAEYAISLGLPGADLEDLTRDEIIALVDEHQANTQDKDGDNPVETEAPAETEADESPSDEDPAEGETEAPAPDFTKFTNPQATKTTPTTAKPKTPATVTPQVSGVKHQVKGGDTKAVVIEGTFMVKDEGKRPRFAHKGDIVVLPKAQVEHGVKYGTLQKL